MDESKQQDINNDVQLELLKLKKQMPGIPEEMALSAARSRVIQVHESRSHMHTLVSEAVQNNPDFGKMSEAQRIEFLVKAIRASQKALVGKILAQVEECFETAAHSLIVDFETGMLDPIVRHNDEHVN